MKILITGGSGVLARNLAPMFEAKKHEVFNPGQFELNLLKWDSITNYFELHDHHFDAVIHTAIKGGDRGKPDTLEDLKANIIMFENLTHIVNEHTPIVIYGSGAEFDQRKHIDCAEEEKIVECWPIDPYGLSKNLITRRAIDEHRNISILRLFGCFHHNEEPTRFIRHSIENLLKGKPIEIDQNRDMDFFYLDDVFTVTEFVLKSDLKHHMNLVYPEKLDLLDIAGMLHKTTSVNIKQAGKGIPYTGDGTRLKCLNLPLIGLKRGLQQTTNKLAERLMVSALLS